MSSTGKTAKRHLALRTSKPVVLNFCPAVHGQCPVAGVVGEFECVETLSEMTSCGGCASTGAGVDCTTIPYVEYASCYGGFCSGIPSVVVTLVLQEMAATMAATTRITTLLAHPIVSNNRKQYDPGILMNACARERDTHSGKSLLHAFSA